MEQGSPTTPVASIRDDFSRGGGALIFLSGATAGRPVTPALKAAILVLMVTALQIFRADPAGVGGSSKALTRSPADPRLTLLAWPGSLARWGSSLGPVGHAARGGAAGPAFTLDRRPSVASLAGAGQPGPRLALPTPRRTVLPVAAPGPALQASCAAGVQPHALKPPELSGRCGPGHLSGALRPLSPTPSAIPPVPK